MMFIVSDMTCGHCRAAIEKAVSEAGGSAAVDLDTQSVRVEGLEAERAAEVIRAAGFSPRPA